MTGETDPKHHFCPPLREPSSAPRSDLSQTEQRVTDAFFRGIPPMLCHGGKFVGGEVVLEVSYLQHRQAVRGRTLIDALAQAQRLFTALHPSQEAA